MFALTASKLGFDTTVCCSDMKSALHVKDEAQYCSVGKSETLGHTQEPFQHNLQGRVGHLSDRFLFFTEPAFHLLPQPLLCSSEEHQ